MKQGRQDGLALFLVSLAVRSAVALLIGRPGHMDAAYYASGAVWMAQGGGFTEPFIWNYLSDPSGIPHPGFLYWMPLPSLLAAPFAALFPGSFLALQIPFVGLSAALPVVTYCLAWQATTRRRLAWAAALLTLFSGFFFPYWTVPETFAPFALLGCLALWLAGRPAADGGVRATGLMRWLSVGVLTGLAHLTRADGILFLPLVALAPLVARGVDTGEQEADVPGGSHALIGNRDRTKRRLLGVVTVIVGYILVMGPWFARNSFAVGTPLSPAGTKTMWLTEYDDLFCYNCDLSPSSYLAWGWDGIASSKLRALWLNFQRFLAEDCLVFLLPLVIVGFYRLRRRLSFVLALLYLILICFAHSLVFTFPGLRGGFFHASSAALPFLYAAAMEGLDGAVRWAARRRRGWRYRQAQTVFAAASVALAVLLSGYAAWLKIPAWRTSNALYTTVDEWLIDQERPSARVMVGDPPAFWYHTGRASAVVPNGDIETLLAVADRYRMRYVLLEGNHPAPLSRLHGGEEHHPRLQLARTWADGDAVLFEVLQ